MNTKHLNSRIEKVWRGPAALLCATLMFSFAAAPSWAAPKDKPTDAEIAAAVDGDLFYDSSVAANDIDVVTVDGVVTLSGEAPNLLAKERATKIAETVRGVRAVVNDIKVKPVSRSDGEVKTDVLAALLADPATDSYEVKTSVANGVVTLTGTVDSWQEKQLSAAVAKGVKGVREVKNDISVRYATTRPDNEIAQDVRASLKRDVWVNDVLISSTVKDAKVTLTGTVGSVAEKSRAYSDAWVTGVSQVDDSGLNVAPWAADSMKRKQKIPPKSDAEIMAAVKDAFFYDPRVSSFDPSIMVEDGTVTLTGTVGNLRAKEAAGQDAKNTTGVWRVKNYLKVRVPIALMDDTLEKNVAAALERDPYVDRYEITVTAYGGVISLNGTVDSIYEKTHAEDVASRVNGVKDVNNSLTVSYQQYGYYYWPYYGYYYEPYRYWPGSSTTQTLTSDERLREAIQDEFFWSPFVDGESIHVTVSDGVATLKGSADGWGEASFAVQNALQAGATRVNNQLITK